MQELREGGDEQALELGVEGGLEEEGFAFVDEVRADLLVVIGDGADVIGERGRELSLEHLREHSHVSGVGLSLIDI